MSRYLGDDGIYGELRELPLDFIGMDDAVPSVTLGWKEDTVLMPWSGPISRVCTHLSLRQCVGLYDLASAKQIC